MIFYSNRNRATVYDSAIPLLGICPEKTRILMDAYSLMFIAAISINRGMEKEDVVHIFNGILFKI